MPLHLVKLCVGCESIAELEGWIAETSAERRRRKQVDEQIHTTRMMPKRVEDILDGGSLYWVIKGMISCRQTILDLRQITGSDGISRCAIVLEQKVVTVEQNGLEYLGDVAEVVLTFIQASGYSYVKQVVFVKDDGEEVSTL